MKKKRFSTEQIAAVLHQVEQGMPVADVCRQVGISEQSFYLRIPVHREHSFRFNVNARSGDGEHRFRSS